MAKTAAKKRSRRIPSSQGKERARRHSKRVVRVPWYRRSATRNLGIAAAVVVVAAMGLFVGGRDENNQSVTSSPVVGADLHSLVTYPSHPATLYIGSHQGVSVSRDSGATWRVVPSLDGADAMGWAFTDGAILVGGHPGIRISEDGGRTFEARNDGLPATDIHALGAGDSTVFAASPAAGFLSSGDGGRSWQLVTGQVGQGFMGRILVDPADARHLIAPDMQAGVAESRDGGKSWTALGGLRGAMWVTWEEADTSHIIVVSPGSAAETRDGGDTWQQLDVPDGASIVEMSSGNAATLYAAVLDAPNARVWTSHDGGHSWNRL